MGIVFKNNAKTTLASSLSNSATSATVADGAVFPSLSAGEHFLITFDDGSNNEICKCTARSGNTLTIVRAQESTTARAFSSGDAAEGRVTAGVLETIQENIAAKSANQTVFNATTSGNATTYNIGVNPGVEANAMVFLNGVLQHHDTISFSGVNLTFDAAPPNGMALEVIVDNLINLQSSNLTVDSFTAADVGGSPQTAFTLSDSPAAETNLIVFVEGVFQDQDAYTISSNTLTITTGVIAGRGVTVYIINPVNIGTPSDGTVTSAKLSGNITTPGTLTVGSHDVAFDSPTFVVDNANSRVGLGTASPSVPVDIVGDVKMSANLTVDTTTLVVDSSNNRVGIGQTPGDDFEVKTDNAMSFTSDTSDSISFGTSGTNKPCIKFDTANTTHTNRVWAIENGQGDRLNFFRNGLDVFKLNQDGSVEIPGKLGIGNTVASSMDAGANNLVVGTGSGTEGMTIYSGTANSGVIYFADGASGDDRFRGQIGYSHSDNAFSFRTNASTSANMTIDSSGNVGIGTDSPSYALDVRDGIVFAGRSVSDQGTVSYTNTSAAFSSRGVAHTDSRSNVLRLLRDGTSGVVYAGYADFDLSRWEASGVSSRTALTIKLGHGNAGSSETDVMTLRSNGNVGIGDTSPAAKLEIKQGSANWYEGIRINRSDNATQFGTFSNNGGATFIGAADTTGSDNNAILFGNSTNGTTFTERVRIASDGALVVNNSGGNAQIYLGGTSGTSRMYLARSAADVLLWNVSDGHMRFGTNNIERMRVDNTGNLLHGVQSTSAGFITDGGIILRQDNGHYMQIASGTTSDADLIIFYKKSGSGVTLLGSISSSGNNLVYGGTSDYRLKENIKPLKNGLQKLKKLNPVQFDWKETGGTNEGFIAHEVQDICKEAVSGEKDGELMQRMDYGRITPILVKAIQEQQEQIDELKAKLEDK